MAPDPDDRAAFDQAARWLAALMSVALAGSIAWERSEPLAIAGAVGLVAVGFRLWRIDAPQSALPTLVTGVRIALTTALAFFGVHLAGIHVALGVLLVFGLDGLDGFLARRLGSVSRLGAQLDNEGDAFLVAVVCLLLWLRPPAGAWVLTAGFLRYFYVLAIRWLPSRGHVPASKLATRSYGIALMGFLVGFLQFGVVSRITPLLATLLLVWSFARSFYWSLRKV